MWQAGTETRQWKFDRVIKEIQERNVDAYIYLMKLDPEKWTLLHDGGHRHSIMTTNISEALNMCRENGSRTDTYVREIYSRQTYRRTYQTNFHPVLSENFWRDVPFNLTFYPPNMKKECGRKQGKRFQGKWIIEIQILPQDVVDVACRDIIGKIVITPDRAMYKFDIFLK
ncbi:hypothetical protein M9H77_30694 [Catharanthus roseus]|uniref:Uncharacterized protein n=1 Tax=Catharanthus roseus TaxID=4058 RepID=A0ACC0A0L6_CATRO|nr:hypothetical protein M9H77_30694 [Catharanthus roseus]